MKYASLKTLTLISCLCLLFSACGKDEEVATENTPPPPPAPARGVPDDVPLYHLDADAKQINYEVTETDIIVTMETINGPMSPITYYRNLETAGWKITQDTENEGGTILATKKKRELEVIFKALPGGAGTIITLRTTKE